MFSVNYDKDGVQFQRGIITHTLENGHIILSSQNTTRIAGLFETTQ